MIKLILPLTALIVFAGLIGWYFQQRSPLQARQSQIHAMGSSVMPFDLNQTTHFFQVTDTGGLQQIRSKDPNNTQQISLIQGHLRTEADLFAQGDFSDPAQLHGADMPGLSTLQASAGKFTAEYQDLADGGQIIYQTDNPEVIQAIHQWFMAQLHDHGPDATDNTSM